MKRLFLLLALLPLFSFGQVFENDFEDKDLQDEDDLGSLVYNVSVASNPEDDDVNSSNYVLKVGTIIHQVGTVSAYSPAGFMYIDDRTRSYMWKSYTPTNAYSGVSFQWGNLVAFKRRGGLPFVYQTLTTNVTNPTTATWHFVNGDEYINLTETLTFGEWVEYALEIVFTSDNTGSYRFYKNRTLIFSRSGVTTHVGGRYVLPDFGGYLVWPDPNSNNIFHYYDDITIYNGTIDSHL